MPGIRAGGPYCDMDEVADTDTLVGHCDVKESGGCEPITAISYKIAAVLQAFFALSRVRARRSDRHGGGRAGRSGRTAENAAEAYCSPVTTWSFIRQMMSLKPG